MLCGRCSVNRWLFGHLCQAKGDNERACVVDTREGSSSMIRCQTSPLEPVHEQVSKDRVQGMGLCKVQLKSSKRRFEPWGTTQRWVPETHDSLAWLVSHAAATINWFRPGLDGKTPYELRVRRNFRRPVAPWGQKEGLVHECVEARERHQR